MTQSDLVSMFGDEHFDKFNESLFNFKDEDIIEALKKVILSCQRNGSFVIKVTNFTVIEDYKEIRDTLKAYDESQVKKGKDGKPIKKITSVYDYINLKDSDIKLLVVDYHIGIKEKEEEIRVYISVPRIINKYYFKISGNEYSAMYQIVDASTYNNSNSNSKVQSVTLKTMFMAIRIYRTIESVKTTKKEQISIYYYKGGMFSKTISIFKYFLAKYGWYGTLELFHIPSHVVRITDYDPNDDNFFTFMKNDIYVSVAKFIFERSTIVQSFVYNTILSINKNSKIDNMFTTAYWIDTLGSEFSNNSYEKGLNILDSFEFIYDQITKETIHLPEEMKCDTYHIIKWVMTEFDALRQKDNLDISTKRIRKADYIASLYAMKLAKGIYRISDLGKRADIMDIKRAIVTKPNYLLTQLSTKCTLVNYRNMVNDLDVYDAGLKFSYKGIAGIGEKKGNTIPKSYRYVYPEHLGRLDLDSSSNTDPGVTGILCPTGDIYDGSFSEFEEPHTWDESFSNMVEDYRKMIGVKQAIEFKEAVLGIGDESKCIINDSIQSMKQLIKPIIVIDQTAEKNSIDMTDDGLITLDLGGDDNGTTV